MFSFENMQNFNDKKSNKETTSSSKQEGTSLKNEKNLQLQKCRSAMLPSAGGWKEHTVFPQRETWV